MDEVSAQGNDHSGESKFDDSIATEQLRVFKDFDFLEYELESSEVIFLIFYRLELVSGSKAGMAWTTVALNQ